MFCADAIADPLTGVCGALAVARSVAAGGGELIDLSMRAVAAAFAAAPAVGHGPHEVRADGTVSCARLGREQAVLPPARPRARRPGRAGPGRGHRCGARLAGHVLIRNARAWPRSANAGAGATAGADGDRGWRAFRWSTCGSSAAASPSARLVCARSADEEEIDADGCALLPGLHDHHVHLRALAAAQASAQVGPEQVRTAAELLTRLREHDASLPADAWLRCVGYHESVAGPLDRWALDRMLPNPDRPVRVQHRTGALWVVNSAALARLGLDGRPSGQADGESGVERDADGRATGRLWRMDRWLADRVPARPADLAAGLASVSARAAALGVTGFTDATPGASASDVAGLAAAAADGAIVQRLLCMARADVSARREDRGSASGR